MSTPRPLRTYAVRDASGKLLRLPRVCENDAAVQARADHGETVALATPADLAEADTHRAAIRGEVARMAAARVDPMQVLLEALRAKGIELSPADLQAAATRLRPTGNNSNVTVP